MNIKDKAQDIIQRIKEEKKVLAGEESKDKIYSSARSFPNERTAKREFFNSKAKLFLVNAWSNIPGIANATFTLYSGSGHALPRQYPEIGDFIRIDLPGPLPIYWVEVTSISEQENAAQFIVKPTHDPTKESDDNTTDHFFGHEARSIFRVERNGKEITAMEIGLDEAINNEGEEAGDKSAINTIVSEAGWAGFQKYQWKNLTDYLVGTS